MGRVFALLERGRMWLIDNRREAVLYALFFLVSVISFSLGYVVASQEVRSPIIVEKNTAPL